jgi:dimeric dUTPase (all-alpha-NTP-PPase superfamily)
LATGNICEGQYFSEEILENYIDGEHFFLSLTVEINQMSPSYHDEEDLIIHET